MSDYVIGIGSNIDPEYHIAQGILALLYLSPQLHVSRILVTEPVNVQSETAFFNLAVALSTPLSGEALKERFNHLETELGRDRNDPHRKIKSRTLDLDILFSFEGNNGHWPIPLLPDEPYLRPQVQELLRYLDLPCGDLDLPLPFGTPIILETVTIGQHALTIGRGPDDRLRMKSDPGT